MFLRIKNNLAQTYQFLRRHPGLLLGIIVISASLLWFWASPARAAGIGITDIFSIDGWKRIVTSFTLDIANLFLRISLFMLSFIMQISAYNGYLNATAVNVGWVMVRDITNMLFVIILLIIAFGTILGIEQYEWKKLIVKFVLAAVFVNFSRIICGVFIDISQLVMTTFVNGIAATAGGNLINAFSLENITKISDSASPSALAPGMFTASVAAIVFAGMVMAVLAIFVFMLVARVIRLWVLIVLSPIAFVMSVIPITQKFASNWWSEFGDDLVTGPVLLFFIWLSFVTVGSGKINEEMTNENSGVPEELKIKSGDMDKLAGQSAGIGDAMGWNDMASFAIGIGMLIAGAKVAASIGGSSGSALTGVTSFGKKVATIASGVAAGQWLMGKGKSIAGDVAGGLGKVAKGAAYYAPYVGGEKIARKVKKEWEGVRSWAALDEYSPETRPVMEKFWVKNKETGEMEEKERIAKDEDGYDKYEMVEKDGEVVMTENKRSWLQRSAHSIRESDIRSQKNLEKVTKQREVREGLTKARVKAAPRYWMQYKDERADALDRAEQGELDAEKMRSEAKTKQYAGAAKAAVLAAPRWQEGKFQEARPGKPLLTMAGQIAGHNLAAETAETAQKKSLSDERTDLISKGKAEQDRRAQLVEEQKELMKTTREREVDKKLQTARQQVQASIEVGGKFHGKLEEIRTKKGRDGKSLADLEGKQGQINGELTELLKSNPKLASLLVGQEKDEEIEKRLMGEDGTLSQKGMAKLNQQYEAREITKEQMDDIIKKAQDQMAEVNARKAERQEQIRKDSGLGAGVTRANLIKAELKETGKAVEAKKEETNRERVAVLKRAEDEAGLGAALEEQKNIRTGKDAGHEAEKKTDEYKARVARAGARIKDIGEGVLIEGEEPVAGAAPAVKWIQGKFGGELVEHQLKQMEEEIRLATLGIEKFNHMFEQIEMAEMGETAAKGFIDVIKQQHMADIFGKGGKELAQAVKDLKTGTKSYDEVAKGLKNVGARAALAEMRDNYFKENIAGISKTKAVDEAESLWSLERVGYETPHTALKKATKKQMEALEGVEREKASGMAAEAFRHINYLKAQGKEIDVDQQANYMASVKYLVKNGWSDDMLARIVEMVKTNREGKYTGAEKEETDYMQKLVETWGWDKVDEKTGKSRLLNESSGDRTNTMHRLMGFAGDNNLVMGEDLLLAHQKNQERLGKKMEYTEAATDLTRVIREANAVGGTPEDIEQRIKKALNLDQLAKDLKWGEERVKQQISSFANSFALNKNFADKDNKQVAAGFVDAVKKYGDQMEMLTEIKQEALATTHLDDAGHAIYDYEGGFAHGQLTPDARHFMLGEWVKIDVTDRMRKLKIHGIANMDENNKTASFFDEASWAATFAGVVTKIMIEKLDVRNQRQIIKHGWDEQERNGADGALIVADEQSTLATKTYGHIKDETKRMQAVQQDVARDWAVALRTAPQVLLQLLGTRSGLKEEEIRAGKVKIDLAGTHIRSLDGLVNWIKVNGASLDLNDVKAKIASGSEDKGGGGSATASAISQGLAGAGFSTAQAAQVAQASQQQQVTQLVQQKFGPAFNDMVPTTEYAVNNAAAIQSAIQDGLKNIAASAIAKPIEDAGKDMATSLGEAVKAIGIASGLNNTQIIEALSKAVRPLQEILDQAYGKPKQGKAKKGKKGKAPKPENGEEEEE